ncbi:hypothetical protein EUX98_g3393 [Antrodiella citrinella]|uniref:Uncharacterized protein n=1 Tax=Antrodiella citrinella TaxID=2447956 RepID=A0A4S4N4S7_9APHY|nr:hypothetical protein EUX98_g3393 [Antrodiella citrinella]
MVAWTPEEAGFYLSTYKQFEHKPPDLIKERVDKDYHSVLRTALTSINKVNKTDVETLRSSLGSLGNIAQASSDRLQNLPGFGQVKVKRIKDAFEKPFRNSATSALPFPSQQQTQTQLQPMPLAPAASSGGAGPSTAFISPSTRQTNLRDREDEYLAPRLRPPREASPVWDIELDLNDSPPPPSPQAGPSKPSTAGKRRRSPSIEWDIEGDVDDIEEDADGPRKRPKEFGAPSLLDA